MEVSCNNLGVRNNIFNELNDITLIDYLFLESIIESVEKNKIKILIKDLSYQVLSKYWKTKVSNKKSSNEISILNEVLRDISSKFTLSMDTNTNEIIQVLNYANDKHINVKLYGLIKQPINIFKNTLN